MSREGRVVELKHTRGSRYVTGILRPVKSTGAAAGADIEFKAPLSLNLTLNDRVAFKLGKPMKKYAPGSRRQVIVTKIVIDRDYY